MKTISIAGTVPLLKFIPHVERGTGDNTGTHVTLHKKGGGGGGGGHFTFAAIAHCSHQLSYTRNPGSNPPQYPTLPYVCALL